MRAATFADAVNAIPKTATRFAVVWDGSPSTEGDAVHAWAQALPAGSTVCTFILGEQPNARGAEAVGMLPRGDAAGTEAMLAAACEGKLDVLALLGVNPVLHGRIAKRRSMRSKRPRSWSSANCS